ncbi:MAG: CopG family transcriptional regulator [Okeania sp. SIO2C2]|uniref:ribbon-helix-helix domain-containing protein n=1 Tax=Okeania sp. SIO2C2 TaxID=2607787 RepID=UPI0013BB3FE2|nr:CopG family transcriptional regulator [Okeania sp. SIO2C2]NEP88958.1 CopG family transcriptional regulator [Okeania sp. SIO2C2]
MGGKTDLDRVVAYIPPEWKKELEEWAKEDERSMSWLVGKLIERGLQEHRNHQNSAKVVNIH